MHWRWFVAVVLCLVSSLLRLKKIVMSSGGPGSPRRFSPRGSPSWEKYEGLDSGDDEDEMQNDVFNIPSKKAPLERLRKWRVSVYIFIFFFLRRLDEIYIDCSCPFCHKCAHACGWFRSRLFLLEERAYTCLNWL